MAVNSDDDGIGDEITDVLDTFMDGFDAQVEHNLNVWLPDWRDVDVGEQSTALLDLAMAMDHAQYHVMERRLHGAQPDEDTMRALYRFYGHTWQVSHYVEHLVRDLEGHAFCMDKTRSLMSAYVNGLLGGAPPSADRATAWWLPTTGSWEHWFALIGTYAEAIDDWKAVPRHAQALQALTNEYRDAYNTPETKDIS